MNMGLVISFQIPRLADRQGGQESGASWVLSLPSAQLVHRAREGSSLVLDTMAQPLCKAPTDSGQPSLGRWPLPPWRILEIKLVSPSWGTVIRQECPSVFRVPPGVVCGVLDPHF